MSTGYTVVLTILVLGFIICALSAMFIGVKWWPLMWRSTYNKELFIQREKFKEACRNALAKGREENRQHIRRLEMELMVAQTFKTKLAQDAPQFSPEEIRTLLQLCHPDKHGGKESAMRITQKLNRMRK